MRKKLGFLMTVLLTVVIVSGTQFAFAADRNFAVDDDTEVIILHDRKEAYNTYGRIITEIYDEGDDDK